MSWFNDKKEVTAAEAAGLAEQANQKVKVTVYTATETYNYSDLIQTDAVKMCREIFKDGYFIHKNMYIPASQIKQILVT